MDKLCVLLVFALGMEACAAAQQAPDVLYDCAANTLYLFCRITDNKITYEKSLGLLPLTANGNSMVEMHDALRQCGYEADARIIRTEDLARVDTPSIVLYKPSDKARQIGHFFAIVPQGNKNTKY